MKILLLTFNEHEEKAIDKILATISDCVSLEAVQTIPVPASGMSFPGLEIRLHQRRVLKDGADINLTRLEYGALCYLAASPGRVFTKAIGSFCPMGILLGLPPQARLLRLTTSTGRRKRMSGNCRP